MTPRKAGRLRRLSLLALAAVAVATLGACGGDGDGGATASSAGSGSGVPAGSDAAAYAEALKDMTPITIRFGGMTTGPGTPTVDASVEWAKKVTERSGGKINFDFDYAGAKVSLDKMADALGQGRIDMGMYVQSYQPDKWPVANLATAMSMYVGPYAPLTSRLATFGAAAEFGQTWEPLAKEAEAAGIHPLYPLYPAGDTLLMCAGDGEVSSLADLKGKQVRVVDKTQAALVTELGATPVSLTFPELFTGLQRGVVDCAINSISSFKSGGFDAVLNTWTSGAKPGSDFIDTPVGWGISKKLWDRLPLAARQLLWDSQAEMIEGQIRAMFASLTDAAEAFRAVNGRFYRYGDDATAKIEAFNEKNAADIAKRIEDAGLAPDGAAVVKQYKDLAEKWIGIVTGDLGNPTNLSWKDITKADADAIDVKAFTDKLYQEVLLPRRPA